MQILSLAVVLSAVTWAYNYIIVQNRQRNLVWITIVLVVANVGLNLYFVPTYSYIASTVATDVTTALGMALAIIVAVRYQSVRPSWLSLLKIVGATLAMLAVIQLLRVFIFPTTTLVGTVVMITVGAIVYGMALLATGGVDDGVMLLSQQRLARLTGRTA
jgi:O-antigen/teichoic acid export membrane protein